MPQRGDNPNEVLYEDNTPFGYLVTNYSDYERLMCRSPEDILAAVEEHFYEPLAFVQFREERIARWHHCKTHGSTDSLITVTLTYEQTVAQQTEDARLIEFFIHERITAP